MQVFLEMGSERAGGSPTVPARLPGEGSLRLRGGLEQELLQAERALCRLEGAAAALPAPAAFARMQVRCEAVASCLLDGARVTLPGLLSAEAGLAPPDVSSAASDADRCVRALERLLAPRVPGALAPETLQEAVGILHDPAREAAVEGFLRDAAAALGDRSGLPPLVRVGFVLARTERSGLFGAAAGRAARLLAGAALSRRAGAAVRLSGCLLRHAPEYRRGLESVLSSGSWEGWIGFVLRAVRESAGECAELIARFAALREEVRADLASGLGYALPKGLAVLERLWLEPLASVSDVQGITRTSYVAANGLVSRMAELGVLEEVTGHRRNRVFWFGRYVRAFDAGASGPGDLPPVAPREAASSPDRPPKPETPPEPAAPQKARKPPSRPRAQMSDHLL